MPKIPIKEGRGRPKGEPTTQVRVRLTLYQALYLRTERGKLAFKKWCKEESEKEKRLYKQQELPL